MVLASTTGDSDTWSSSSLAGSRCQKFCPEKLSPVITLGGLNLFPASTRPHQGIFRKRVNRVASIITGKSFALFPTATHPQQGIIDVELKITRKGSTLFPIHTSSSTCHSRCIYHNGKVSRFIPDHPTLSVSSYDNAQRLRRIPDRRCLSIYLVDSIYNNVEVSVFIPDHCCFINERHCTDIKDNVQRLGCIPD